MVKAWKVYRNIVSYGTYQGSGNSFEIKVLCWYYRKHCAVADVPRLRAIIAQIQAAYGREIAQMAQEEQAEIASLRPHEARPKYQKYGYVYYYIMFKGNTQYMYDYEGGPIRQPVQFGTNRSLCV